MYYIHKYGVAQEYGGGEEGGWWFDTGWPVEDWCPIMVEDEDTAYFVCRALNGAEYVRRDKEETYDYTSVLAHQSQHFEYGVTDSSTAESYPKVRPHYE